MTFNIYDSLSKYYACNLIETCWLHDLSTVEIQAVKVITVKIYAIDPTNDGIERVSDFFPFYSLKEGRK